MPVTELDALQARVGAWGRDTFPKSSLQTISDHLAEEVIELLGDETLLRAIERAEQSGKSLSGTSIHRDMTATESADCVLLLLHLAHRMNFSLDKAVRAKFLECQKRTWDSGAERGYSRHVEPPAESETP